VDKARESVSSWQEDAERFRQIVSILAKHHLGKGLTPQKLRSILEDLGPTFIKLGQVLSMRSDVLPAPYCRELAGLRADVTPMPVESVTGILEQEYGCPWQEIFAQMEPVPLGSASIAQVHLARLTNGEQVVVKVQRPGIYETMAQDINLLKRAARLSRFTAAGSAVDFSMVLDELWNAALGELDFLSEARNLKEFRTNNRNVAYVDGPAVWDKLTTRHVLVMEYIHGVPIDDLASLRADGYDLDEIGAKLAENFIKQIVEDRFFHADPHPGNIRIREGQIVWLDLGMMGRISSRDGGLLNRGIRAVAENDVEALTDIILAMGAYTEMPDRLLLGNDIDNFLAKYRQIPLADMNLGSMMEECLGIANKHGISMPGGMTMLMRSVITIEGVLSVVSPGTNILKIMSLHVSEELLDRGNLKEELRTLTKQLVQSGEKLTVLPSQLSDTLRKILSGQFRLNVRTVGPDRSFADHEKIADRLITGLLICALLLGACLLCIAGLTPAIAGLPWMSVGMLSLAAILAAWLLLTRKK